MEASRWILSQRDSPRPCRCAVINQANAGPGAARNRGASEGRGELLAFTDDDCTPEPGWLANLESQLVAEPDCVAGGRMVNILRGFGNVCSASSQSLVSYLYTYYNRDPAARALLHEQ